MSCAPSWVFDWYPVPGGMAVWLLDERGAARRVVDPWTPTFHVRGPHPGGRATTRIEFTSGRPIRVTAVEGVARGIPADRLYDADIPPAQLYAYQRGIFALARVDANLRPLDSPWDEDYALPPMRTMEIGTEGARINPTHGRPRAALEVKIDGRSIVLDDAATLAELIEREDPDIVATHWGDEWMVPALEAAGVVFHRDREAAPATRGRRRTFSYGQFGYSGGSRPFLGRWHLDMQNSFLLRECGLDGLLDLARLTKIPVQQMTRCTIGTSLTSMQLDAAYREGVLIPCVKRQTEEFKTAEQLLLTDKGGLTYVPPVGAFTRVSEIDFASMYPTIMARFNVSPETVNCACCAGEPIPEIGTHTCRRRRGLIPRVLEPILARRARYKARRDRETGAAREMYDRRQTALKWCLVTSFGYLGFRNARFGRIEAHEAVTAYSREILLRAKEIAEARGFRMLHAIVDSLWVDGPGDARALAAEIERETGMPVGFEGTYRWILFPPSRTHPRIGVHNRYAGAFESGKLKVRGLELRRHDTPRIVRRMQQALLEHLAAATTLDDLRALAASQSIVDEYVLRVRDGEVTAADLTISRTLTRAPREYRQNNLTAIVARQIGDALMPGERVGFIVMDDRNPVPERRAIAAALAGEHWEYDPRYYEALVRRAAESVLTPVLAMRRSAP